MEQEEILEKIKRYLEEKLDLSEETCYFITKRLNEDYWAVINSEAAEDEGPEEESDDLFEEKEDLTEPEQVEEPEAEEPKETPVPEPPTKPQVKRYEKRPPLLPKMGI